MRWIQVLACYATAVALNFVLPANIGTLVMMLMFTTVIAHASSPGCSPAAWCRQCSSRRSAWRRYLYLFLSVGGSLSVQFRLHRASARGRCGASCMGAGWACCCYLVFQTLRPRIAVWWEEAQDGGQIAAQAALAT